MPSVGVIEIGSNGLRYEVARIDHGLEEVEYRSAERSNLIGLLDERKGLVSPRFRTAVVQKIENWLADGRTRKLDKLVVVTTEVGRAVERIDEGYWRRHGLVVNTLTARSEAQFAYRAAKRIIDAIGSPAILMDVGNGSMSIALIESSGETELFTLAVGAERLSRIFVNNKEGADPFPDFLKKEFSSVSEATTRNIAVMGGLATKTAWHVLRESQNSRYNARLLSGRSVVRTDLQRGYSELRDIVAKRGEEFAQDFVDAQEKEPWKLVHLMTGLRFFDAFLGFVSAQRMSVCTDSVRHGVIRFLGESDGIGEDLSAVW
jgi:exopolyphosphatase/pppGpp-phosphohydrolase